MSIRRRRTITAALHATASVALGVFLGIGCAGDGATGPGDRPRVAFAANRDGVPWGSFGRKFQIYVADADGNGIRRVSADTSNDLYPSWSPDGRRIVFQSFGGGSLAQPTTTQLVVVDADGRGRRQLTSGTADRREPAWSPDGTRIAFVLTRDGRSEVAVIDADGTGERSLTQDRALAVGRPAWSADGQRLAFASSRAGRMAIYTMRADGSELVGVTTGVELTADHPAWAPDGSQLVFGGRDGTGAWHIYAIRPDGGGFRQLTQGTALDIAPSFTPDGRAILFTRNPAPTGTVNESAPFLMDVDGGNVRPLFAPDGFAAIHAVWRP